MYPSFYKSLHDNAAILTEKNYWFNAHDPTRVAFKLQTVKASPQF
jgi:hypothetical protein